MPQTIPSPVDTPAPAPHFSLLPAGGDNTGQLGNDATRWQEIRGVEVEAGDLSLRALDGSAHWKLIEAPGGIRALNMLTGQEFMLGLVPISDIEGGSP